MIAIVVIMATLEKKKWNLGIAIAAIMAIL